MISYNQKNPFSYIFRFHRGDTFRKMMPPVIFIALYAGGVAWLELEFWKLSESSKVKNIALMHTLLSFVISILLVFRTNTAYDRWWEGRRLWGSLVNNSRNLAMKLGAMLPVDGTQRLLFKQTITAYAQALHEHLRKEKTGKTLFDDDDDHGHIFGEIDHEKHVPNQLLALMYTEVQMMQRDKTITGEEMLFLNSELMSFNDICGGCERIKNTPIPFAYSVFIRKFLFIYILTLPFGYVFSLGYYVIPVVAFVFYVLGSLELIAEEIEDPFSGDLNDVPTQKIAETIKGNMDDLL